MSTYLVTYDLSAPGRNYDGLIGYIKTYPYAHVTESSWVIQTRKTASQVLDEIRRYVDSNDHVLAIQTTQNSASIGLSDAVGNWLKQHLVAA